MNAFASKQALPRASGLLISAALLVALAGCGGGSGGGTTTASAGTPASGIATGPAGLTAATQLVVTVTAVRISGPPQVDFSVVNQANNGMTGLVAADLRFNIAKLVPGANGGPSDWQNYINRANGGAVQGSQERVATGYVFGTLVGHGSGNYTYTFATDITDPTANPCPAPCTDAGGNPLDISYAPALTHRVTVQQANLAYPEATGVLDFVPAGGGVVTDRDIVATATCDTCHAELSAHGNRVDTRLCVTCHNPGSWVAGAPNTTVDFKVMIHRIHYNAGGLALPSVLAGVPYKIGSTDFSAVTFTQDVRNCERCHSASAGGLATPTAQGDYWKTAPNIDACSSCHDDVYFGAAPDPTRPYQTKAHPGGVMTDSSTCAMCHAAGNFNLPQDIVIAHSFPAMLKAEAAKFQFNILSVTATTPGANPVVTFSVTDPTNGNAPYNLATAPAFTAGAASAMTVKFAWSTSDFANNGSGQPYGQPASVNALTAAAGAAPGTYTVTSPVAVPVGQTGTLRVIIDGHPAGDVTTPGTFADRLAVKSVFMDAAITGSVVPRRLVVDIAKCDVCHDVLSLHGNNRTEEIGVCVVCHNPNATDRGLRPAVGLGVDGKVEEAVDFKTMIHAIHAGEADKGGFRTKGIVVYGFGGSVNDFSSVVFPGHLNDCSTCHIGVSYQLQGLWAAPTANGILGTTFSSGASALDPTDNLRISPTAAVCSSCHDDPVSRLHMLNPGSGGNFSATQAALVAGAPEGCVLCHGAGSVFDVKTVHGVP